MRACVTGASGHIGSNLVHALVDAGHQVSVLARPGSSLRAIEGLAVERREGDILDEASLRAAMDGAEVLFHAAAVYRNWTKDPDEMSRAAVDGTKNALRAAKDAKVRRVVYTSSSNAVGFTKDPAKSLDETVWNDSPIAPYVQAKVAAERAAHALARELGLDVVAVLPTGVLGRFDYRITPTTRAILDVLNRKAPIPFPLNPVDVRDVAAGHLLAADKGRAGERYLLGSENVDVEGLAKILREELELEAKVGMPPGWVLGAVAAVSELASSITGREPMLSRAMAREIRASKGVVFDCSKAERELGLAPRGAREVIRETARWLGFLGLLEAPALAALVRERLAPDPSWLPEADRAKAA